MENLYAICPNCLKPGLEVKLADNTVLTCRECGKDIGLDVFIMSMLIIEKNILIEAVKLLFLMKDYKLKGLCVMYSNTKYIVGFDKNDLLLVSQYDSSSWRLGLIVDLKLNYNKDEENGQSI